MANVLVITSSHRHNSNSGILAHVVAKSAEKKHNVTTVNIAKLKINACMGCDICRKTQKGCVQKDDMQAVYKEVEKADVLILASPIYWFNMAGQLKTFLDRCYAVGVNKQTPLSAKSIGAVFAFEGDDPLDSGCVNAIRSLQDTCAYTGAKWLGAIYGSAFEAGEINENIKALEAAQEFGEKI